MKLRELPRWRPYRLARALFGRPIAPRGKRHLAIALVGLLAIVGWQSTFAGFEPKLDATYKITAASGVHYDRMFVYFLYYLDLFPVVSTKNAGCTSDTQAGCWDTAGTPAEYSHAGAQNALHGQSKSLMQDLGWTWNAGDRGKIYLYLFDAWLKGAPWNPSLKPASRLGFVLGLSSIFIAFWWVRLPAVGALLALFLGSNPFQLYEVYGHDNVFGFPISVALVLLAIHLPLLRRWMPDRRWAFAWPVGVGILLACLRTVRSEPATLMLAAAGTYAFVTGFSWKRRGAMIGTLFVTFALTGALWTRHFEKQHEKSATVIGRLGGHPHPDPKPRLYHHFWHPIWCGLGDYGEKYGYQWNDHAAATYAKPLLEARGVYVPSGHFIENGDPREYYDPDTKLYKKLPYDLPGYDQVIREKVMSDIKRDPGWYLGVLTKRVGAIFSDTTPIRLTHAKGWLQIPWSGFFAVPIFLLLLLSRQKLLAGTLLFTVPTITTAFVVYSARGMTYYGVFHIIAFALALAIALHHAAYWGVRYARRLAAQRVARVESADG